MANIALVFPGQGAQAVGMGRDLYDSVPAAKNIFETANNELKNDIIRTIFEGPEETLKQTQYTQLAVFITSMACLEALRGGYPGLFDNCRFTAGHSLGEYSALCASGVFGFSDGLKLVKARSEYIRQASEKAGDSGMAAVLGLDYGILRGICEAVPGVVEVVNFNCPGQLVIAGGMNAVDAAVKLATEKGAMKAVKLNVSGPFHSSLMEPAAVQMERELAGYTLKKPVIPVVTNCDGEINTEADALKSKMAMQVNHPVLWEKSVRKIMESGADVFIEVGPGRVLSGLLKRIDRKFRSLNVSGIAGLEKTVEALKT